MKSVPITAAAAASDMMKMKKEKGKGKVKKSLGEMLYPEKGKVNFDKMV